MSSAVLAAVLSAVATTAGNIALSERQRKVNEQNQDKQNEYNLPINQVQRLKDAGINPNALTMGNGMSVQGNTSVPMNPYSTPSLVDPMSLISNSMLTMAQGETENEMRELRKAQAAADIQVLSENAKKLGVETQYQSILNAFAAAREHAALVGQFRTNDLTLWQTNKVKQEARQLAKYIDEVMPEEISKLIAEKNLTVGQLDQVIATVANLNADTTLKEHQTDVADTQAALNVEQRSLTAQESGRYDEVTDALLSQYQATVNKLAAEANLTEQEAFYYLYELAMKHSIRVGGMPIIGAGGVKTDMAQQKIMNQVSDKYGK